jgi:predicted  nucleic acid-binding Zn-ribbon protein
MNVSSRGLVVVLTLLAVLGPLAASGQTDPVSSPETAGHLAEISAALNRIVELLESQAESSKLDLIIRRVDLTQRRLEPIEARLRQLRTGREGSAEERFRLRKQLENLADQMAAGTLDVDASEISVSTDYMESELALVEGRLRATDNEITMLENEAVRFRNEIQDWQSWIDRELNAL